MPISLSSKRSLRKSLRNKRDNSGFKTRLKKTVKEFLAKPTSEGLNLVNSILDKAKKKHVFHLNKISRLKSSYSKKIKAGLNATPVVKKTKKTVKAKKVSMK